MSTLEHDERQRVIAALTERLPHAEAVQLLAALAGTRAELERVPMPVQERAQIAILEGLPLATNVIAVSKLGIPTKSDQESLEEILTDEEKADPAFRQRVEDEAQSRHIQRWLVAVRLRGEGKSPEEYMAILQEGARRMAARQS